jgi:hypothetical protein
MNIQCAVTLYLNVWCELRHFVVDLSFVCPLIIVILPAIDETLDIGERCARVPAGILQLVREDGTITPASLE